MEDPLVRSVGEQLDQAETLIDVSAIAASLAEQDRRSPRIACMIRGRMEYLQAIHSKKELRWRVS